MRFRLSVSLSLALLLCVSFIVSPVAPATAAPTRLASGFFHPIPGATDQNNFGDFRCGSQGTYPLADRVHMGDDLAAAYDTDVYAVADGEAVVYWTSSTWKETVAIRHETSSGQVFYAVYGHIDALPKFELPASGSYPTPIRVDAGEKIGVVADLTGYGDHLHFGVRVEALPDLDSWGTRACKSGEPPIDSMNNAGWKDPISFITSNSSSGSSAALDSVDVGLVIDSSGSMSTTDPLDLRKRGAELLVQAAPDGDYLAVVDFDETATVASSALRVPENRDGLLAAIASIDSLGLTNIGAGIATMCGLLDQSPSGNPKAAILLTDGFQGGGDVGPYGDEHTCFQDRGWPIYTIGLSGRADTVLLDRIASETGGEFSFLENADQLVGTYLVIRSRIAGSAPTVDTQVTVPDGGTSELQMNVAAGLRQMSWLNSWPGSTVEMTLGSPSGRQFDCDSENQWVECISGPTFELLTMQLPEHGEWTVSLYGLDVPTSGEEVSLVATGIPALLRPGGMFIDDDGNVHEAFINGLAAGGITLGCNPPVNDNYCPSNSVTRAQMATFLVRALDLPTTSTDYFTDDESSVHESNINAIAAAGITLGCNPPTSDRYCPDSPVTRGQMASFLVRAFAPSDAATDYFTDDEGSIHERNINRLRLAGITKGCNPPANTNYCPNAPVTRAQMATFLVRAIGLTPIAPTP